MEKSEHTDWTNYANQTEFDPVFFAGLSLPLSMQIPRPEPRALQKNENIFFSSIYYVCGTSRGIRIVRAHCIVHLAELFYMCRNPIVVVAQRSRFLFVSFISRSRSFSAMITLFAGAFLAVRTFALLCSHRVAIDADISVQCDDVIHPHHCDPIVWPMHQTTFLYDFGFAARARAFISLQFQFRRLHTYMHCRTGVKAAGRDGECNDDVLIGLILIVRQPFNEGNW